MTEEAQLKEAILRGAKAAREIGKSRERTFEIGEGLMALRSQVLIAMGKDPRINDRSILKSGEYRERMGAALKTYPSYTLQTVFKNDSTRLAYMYVAEYRPQIEAAFADAEIRDPGSTLRLTNPERIKAKFKALTEPPRKAKAAKAAKEEVEAQDRDELQRTIANAQHDYDELFARHIDFDTTPAEKLVELLLDTKASNRKNRLRFIDLVVKYATGNEAKPKKKERKAKAQAEEAGGFAPGVLEQIEGDEAFLQKVEKKVRHRKAEMAAKLAKAKVEPQSGDEGVSPLEGLSDGGSPYTPEELGEAS